MQDMGQDALENAEGEQAMRNADADDEQEAFGGPRIAGAGGTTREGAGRARATRKRAGRRARG